MRGSDKTTFRRITLLIVISLAVLAGLQIFWVARMYRDMNRRFGEKVTAAMERAAYDELTTRNPTRRTIDILSEMFGDDVAQSYSYSFGSGASTSDAQAINLTNATFGTVDTTHTNIVMRGRGGGETRLNFITLTATDRSLSPENFARYDSLLALNLARADVSLPYRLAEVEERRELQARGGEVAHPRTFDIPIGSRRASVVRLSIANPGRGFLVEMAGLVVSSLGAVLLLAFTLFYLLRTLFRQKTLERLRLDFTHNITHELKTPIAVAYAAGDALLNFGADDHPARREKYLRVVLGRLEALSEMVERILALSFEDDFELSCRRVELLPVVREVVEGCELRGAGRFRVDVAAGVTVWADPFQLAIVLSNLVDNAVKYTGAGAGVVIAAFADGEGVTISVSDNGPGIAPAEHERIFEKFYRTPTGNIHTVKGFGLGLYNVRRIVERHGGRACVASSSGHGATFTLHFPDENFSGQNLRDQNLPDHGSKN